MVSIRGKKLKEKTHRIKFEIATTRQGSRLPVPSYLTTMFLCLCVKLISVVLFLVFF